jgi:hypothetical protein
MMISAWSERQGNYTPDGKKECVSCHRVLPIEQFSRDASKADGLELRCKECDKARRDRRPPKTEGIEQPRLEMSLMSEQDGIDERIALGDKRIRDMEGLIDRGRLDEAERLGSRILDQLSETDVAAKVRYVERRMDALSQPRPPEPEPEPEPTVHQTVGRNGEADFTLLHEIQPEIEAKCRALLAEGEDHDRVKSKVANLLRRRYGVLFDSKTGQAIYGRVAEFVDLVE